MTMRNMKALMLMGCALVLGAAGPMPGAAAAVDAPAGTGAGASPAIRVVVDPRVELMSVVFRLAGNPEYNRAEIASYAADVDTFFGRFKDHPAVKMARRLREERGIGYNAPMALAMTIEYSPAREAKVTLAIYDVTGRRVRTLVSGTPIPAGVHTVNWDGKSDSGKQLASGVYFASFHAEGQVEARKLILLR